MLLMMTVVRAASNYWNGSVRSLRFQRLFFDEGTHMALMRITDRVTCYDLASISMTENRRQLLLCNEIIFHLRPNKTVDDYEIV